jgi:pimeloyl-ACP methyl ester carboxylesterase
MASFDGARRNTLEVNGISFALLESGPEEGPLALCLHGYPDTAWTWRHLTAELAEAGWRVAAPFMRGFAPTSLSAAGSYQTGALIADANALHEALAGGADAVLIGHDWGAVAAYGAASHQPERWRRIVTLAIPPAPVMAAAFTDIEQLKRSWYMFFQLTAIAEQVIPLEDFAFLKALWNNWSPGYDATEDVARVAEALAEPSHLLAALGYYRALFGAVELDPSLASEQQAAAMTPSQPTLYMHGRADGCVGAEHAASALGFLADGSEVDIVADAGHFLHLEKPRQVNRRIVEFIGGGGS